MTKRVFRSIFLASLAVLLAMLALILGALYTYFSDVQAEQLRLQTALVAHALETEERRRLSRYALFQPVPPDVDCRRRHGAL